MRDFQAAQASLERSKSQLARLKAGAWKFDIAISKASVDEARAAVSQIKTELNRLVVRASVDGEVLQVNVRPGEFITTFSQQSAIVLGNTKDLHVRVDIDEYDLPRFRPHAPAIARRRGHAGDRFPLTFVRVDPYVVPKRSLTGENTERVDTRVLQVIYEIDSQSEQLYVGQQLDVFIDVEQADAGKSIDSQTDGRHVNEWSVKNNPQGRRRHRRSPARNATQVIVLLSKTIRAHALRHGCCLNCLASPRARRGRRTA